MSSSIPSRLKSMLVDLGKPTMRGIRRCPKCRTVNGTRSSSCKNKQCDAVFKEHGAEKRKRNSECVKVNTGTSALLYSVCLRDRGPNNRGFVQLPTVVDDDGNVATYPVDPAILCQAARCYVDTCPCAATLLNCPTYSINRDCVHIRAAIACTADAQPLEIDPSVVDSLSCVTEDVRTVLRHFIANEACPVIQRVTRSVFVVRSQPACEHTLEFVHVIFTESVRSRVDASRKFTCDCRTFQSGSNDSHCPLLCIHFYLCICAFLSSAKLAGEFRNLIQHSLKFQPDTSGMPVLDPFQALTVDQPLIDFEAQSQLISTATSSPVDLLLSASAEQSDLVGEDDIDSSPTFELIVEGEEAEEVELESRGPTTAATSSDAAAAAMTTAAMTTFANKRLKMSDESAAINIAALSDCVAESDFGTESLNEVSAVSECHNVSHDSVASATHTVTSVVFVNNLPLVPHSTKPPLLSPKRTLVNLEESNAVLTFDDWLSSVTERINQTMHYQFSGKPDPLVFHIPQAFFDCLQQRMSVGVGGRKKRLPNTSISFVRRDAVPLGSFVKYTWRLTNVLHIKQIFDTPQRTLDITRRFVENRDGTFDLFESPRLAASLPPDNCSGRQPIRPAELKTFLKIGPCDGNQREGIPFIIEWIPDVLPQSHVGEMRIQFEFGHQYNGVVQHRPPTTTAAHGSFMQQIPALSTANG